MPASQASLNKLSREIADMRRRLAEAEHTLEAIRQGEVDGFVVYQSPAEQVVLVEGADSPYRLLMDEMEQGACMLMPAGRVVYCNRQLAQLLQISPAQVANALFQTYVPPAEREPFASLLSQAVHGAAKGEISLIAADGTVIPARLTCSRVTPAESPILAVLVSDLTEQKQLQARVTEATQHLRRLTARLQVVQEEERTRIAREIHDQLGGALTGLKMDLTYLAKQAGEGAVDWPSRLKTIAASIDTLINMIRRIATDLRPALLDDFGLLEALQWQLADFQTRSGLECDFICPEGDVPLNPEKSIAVFRVFQEALTNVVRHAQASRVEVRVERQTDSLLLQIHDDGRGLDPEHLANQQSLGLLGMRERIQLLSGGFDISSAPGQGTTIRVTIPM